MRIALIGYGKMGKMLEDIARERGHDIVLKINSTNAEDLNAESIRKSDVAIEFTNPQSAYQNVLLCLQAGVPVVCGTTGWNQHLPQAKAYAMKVNGSFLHASNFSVGVNIFFRVNQLLARLMSSHTSYSASIREIHHTEKKDAPSGTAVTLAEQIIANHQGYTNWVNEMQHEDGRLPIISERADPAPGTHHVKYSSAIDDIEIIHTAHNRRGFAMGALLAAEYIATRKGVFDMNDVLQLH